MRSPRVRFTVGRMTIAVAIVAALLFAMMPPRRDGRLRVEGFPRVRLGMSRRTVEALLGGPPGNYGVLSAELAGMTAEGYDAPPGSVEELWSDDRNRFEIHFDASGRVVGYHRRAWYEQAGPIRPPAPPD